MKELILIFIGFFLIYFAFPVNCQVVRDGLISYWSMDKDNIKEGKVKDLVGGQDATIVGNPKIVKGKVKDALLFNGTSDYLVVSDNINTMNIPKREITLEAWIYPENFIEWGGYISCFQDNGSFEKGWTLGCNWQMSFAISTENPDDGDGVLTYQKANPVEPNNWYHLVGTYDGKKINVYVNGKLNSSNTSHSGDINYPDHAMFTIAIYKDDNEHFPFKGMLDEVKIYRKALSEAEVIQNYNAEGMAVKNNGEKLVITWGNIKSSL